MTTLKTKDIKKMNKEERKKKIDELKFELIKSKSNASKSGAGKAREIRKIISRIFTLNNQENKNLEIENKK